MLRLKREEKGRTQRDLAKKPKVTPGYVAQLEMGIRKDPSLDMWKRLAKAVGLAIPQSSSPAVTKSSSDSSHLA